MKTTGKYILEGKTVVPCDDLEIWGRFMEIKGARNVAKDGLEPYTWLRKIFSFIPLKPWVSTVFLGLNYSFVDNDGPPLLFETMAFDGEHNELPEYTRHCSTWAQAEAQHAEVVAAV